MGDALFSKFYEWAGAERPAGLYAVLDEPQSKWFDDIGTVDRRETRADIFVGRGDMEGARKTLEDAIAYADTLPPEQRSKYNHSNKRR
jgi:hypothetical protein